MKKLALAWLLSTLAVAGIALGSESGAGSGERPTVSDRDSE